LTGVEKGKGDVKPGTGERLLVCIPRLGRRGDVLMLCQGKEDRGEESVVRRAKKRRD